MFSRGVGSWDFRLFARDPAGSAKGGRESGRDPMERTVKLWQFRRNWRISMGRNSDDPAVDVRLPYTPKAVRPTLPASALSIVVVTITLARSSEEARVLERSLRALSKANLPIYVGEGGSEPDFVARLAKLRDVRICSLPPNSKPSLVAQLRAAFAAAEASQPDYVIYTEPDKLNFFAKGLPALIDAARQRGRGWPGLVLAARKPRAFATFPEGQKVAESFMNRLAGEALGSEGDYTYGPMLISNSLLPYTRLLPDNLGWGWRFFLMAVARQLRAQVHLSAVGSACPVSQRDEDDERARAYRLRQLVQNVTGLANGWTCLLDQQLQPSAMTAAA